MLFVALLSRIKVTLNFAGAFSKCMTHRSGTQLKCSKQGGGSWKYPVEKFKAPLLKEPKKSFEKRRA